MVVKGVLSPEQGALFMKALRGACDSLREAEGASREVFAGPDSAEDRHGARNADALECLAESFLAHGHAPLAGRERHVVHVHVDEAVLRDAQASGRCEVEGSAVPPATLQRLCCDASLVTVVEDASGAPKALSRKTRVVSTPLGRALTLRDGGCRFPGCANTRFVHAHHIEHWAHGGPTTLANLITLCTRHHRYLHEYGYRVVMHDGAPQFLQPNGREVITMPTPAPIDAAEGCQRLMDAHAELGIDADTGDSHWGGERMDYEWALLALMGPPGPELDASSAGS